MFRELDTIVLTHDISSHNLQAGDMGAVVSVYKNGEAFEVEFVTASGKTVALLTLTAKDVRSIAKNEILHVRGVATV
jgi:hypothetical protein